MITSIRTAVRVIAPVVIGAAAVALGFHIDHVMLAHTVHHAVAGYWLNGIYYHT